ncbi:hypothetical protein P8A22_36275 [Streptomyces laculatispora]|uniref:Uncharacterized protein n=1 Tax=Streptomyces laculatispora TaxID=887464 RepID=A0ABY9IDL1_9ACTN|nr:hypothetical protein [Streptomyces laculatispora]WLQ44875.1 hypothetical protein P8A22_36275 [Streptomyces laculatispora]
MANYIADNIPTDLPLSPKVQALRKAFEAAAEKLSTYKIENARYRTRDVSQVGELKARYSTPALEDAKAELKVLEIEAVREGKALPNKEVFLGTVRVAIGDYGRTVSALESLVKQAHKAFSEAVREELVPMGLKAAKAAQKARDEWEKAHKAAMTARGKLETAASLFTWCATSGQVETIPLEGASAGNKVEHWELSEDGRLTTDAAIELGFQGLSVLDGLVVIPAPVIDPEAEAEAEFWRTYKPQIHAAKSEGYGPNWEH